MKEEFASGEVANKSGKFSRYSVFSIGNTLFGLEILAVKEVLPLPPITKVPNVAPYVLGVFNLRGNITPLIDIRFFLGLEISPLEDSNMILLLEQKNVRSGILVERVLDIVNVDEGQIELPTRNLSPLFGNYVGGLYEKEGLGTIHLFDTERLIQSPELHIYS